MASKLLCLGVCFITIALDPRNIGARSSVDVGLWFTKEPPRQAVALKSQPFYLECAADGVTEAGPVTYSWIKDSSPVVRDDRREVLRNNSSLYIERVIHRKDQGRTDEGSYRCAATNKLGTILSRTSQLYVAGLKFSGKPRSLEVTEGESARLECKTEGKPQPTISWEKNSQPLPLNLTRYTVLTSGVLQIINVVQSDAGEYRCTASNIGHTKHSKQAHLTVITGPTTAPQLLSGPQDQSRFVGETAILECLATGLPLPQIVWTRQDGTVVQLNQRVTLVGESNLRITNLTLEDTGRYVCQLEDDPEEHQTASLKVLSNEPPRALLDRMTPANTLVNHPLHCKMQCDFDNFDNNITWFYNGQKLPESWANITQEKHGRELKLRWCLRRHTGLYQCVAQNAAGMTSHTIHFVIEVAEIPAVKNLEAAAQSSTSIRFSWDEPILEGNITIVGYSVHYERENRVESQKVVKEVTHTVLDQLDPNCNYKLSVVVYTTYMYGPPGQAIHKRTLESAPSATPKVTVTTEGPTSLKVEWDELILKKACHVITHYKVKWRKEGEDQGKEIELNATSQRQYIIEDLLPLWRYEVTVLAATTAGYPSQWVDEHWQTASTGPGENTGVPSQPQLRLEVLPNAEIRASWDMPTNGPRPEHFELKYWKLGEDELIIEEAILEPEDITYRITQLAPNTYYVVELLASNEYGKSRADVKQTSTQESFIGEMPPPTPQDVHVKAVNATAVSITWHLPHHSKVTHCTVRSSVLQTDQSGATQNNGKSLAISTNNSLVVANLRPFTKYSFSVRAHTSQMGAFSDPVTFTTPEGRPSAPQNPALTLLTDNAIRITWHPPKDKNGIILRYIVQYCVDEIEQANDWKNKEENGSAQYSLVEELQVNTLYVFKVQAATRAGDGPSTDRMLQRTRPPLTDGGDKELGIIVGIVIGGSCIIICALVLFIRSRCCLRREPASIRGAAEVLYANGNGHVPNGHVTPCQPGDYLDDREAYEPMVTRLPQNDHLDTKGGAGQNGRVPHEHSKHTPHMQVCCAGPNGKVSTFLFPGHPALKHLKGRIYDDSADDLPETATVYSRGIEDKSPVTQQSSIDPTHCSLEDIDRSENSEDEELETSFVTRPQAVNSVECNCSPVHCEQRVDKNRHEVGCQLWRPNTNRYSVPTRELEPSGTGRENSETNRPTRVVSGPPHNGRIYRDDRVENGQPWQERVTSRPYKLSPQPAAVTEPEHLQSDDDNYVTSVL